MKTKTLLIIIVAVLVPGAAYLAWSNGNAGEISEYGKTAHSEQNPEEEKEETSETLEETFLIFDEVSLQGATETNQQITDERETEILSEREEVVAENEAKTNSFIQCLADAGVVIYGSVTCPACTQLVNMFGGPDTIAPIYVECTKEVQRCQQEMQTNYVPEIQIKGVVCFSARTPAELAEKTGCEL